MSRTPTSLTAGICFHSQRPRGYQEGHELMFRAEFCNLTNNTNFANSVNSMTAPTFGQILGATGTPRVIEFALKYIF